MQYAHNPVNWSPYENDAFRVEQQATEVTVSVARQKRRVSVSKTKCLT
jgi:uncharacterized protein YyaL (SSP411 family)